MSEDWLLDVKKYVPDADETAVAGIIRYCGIALRNRDSSLVSFGDPAETGRVRENFLKKKLGLTDSDAVLDDAIAAVGDRMKGDHFRNRVTVYYLLARQFGKLGLFNGGAAAAAEATPIETVPPPPPAEAGPPLSAAAGVAAFAATAAASAAGAGDGAGRTTAGDGGAGTRTPEAFAASPSGDKSIFSKWWLWLLILLALLLLFLLLRSCHGQPVPVAATDNASLDNASMASVPVENIAASGGNDMSTAAVPASGARVETEMQDGKPALIVYFDTAKADVPAEFADKSADVKVYVAAHPDAKLAVSGFNDPTGNAAFNAQLAKHRAQAVAAALNTIGIAKSSVVLEKPADATMSGSDNSASRRVEVTVK